MKKKRFMILCVSALCALSLAACGTDGNPTSVSSSGEPTVTQSSTNEGDPSAQLKPDDAYQLVSEKAPDLSISANDTVTVDGHTYYLYLVSDSVSGVSCNYVVDNQSGEVSVYTEDGKIQPLSSSPFAEEDFDTECNWDGTFTKGTLSFELMQGDPQSFEFSVIQEKDMVPLTGVASVHGNLARFQDEEAGIILDFVMDQKNHTLTVSGDESYDGVYQLSE